MESLNAISSTNAGITRKLLVGEQVEVRQRDKGLRGSWHPAVVVKVKPGRRVVEYDELLSSDGLHKLRESIPVTRELEEVRVLARQPSPLPERTGCGLLRPRPPIFSEYRGQSWIKGLLIDAFYEDAWWEGILLENVSLGRKDASVTVFFPDEGDKQRVSLTKLRLSLDWNEATGHWTLKGQLVFSNLDGRDGLLSMMEIWKENRRTGKLDAFKKECRILTLIQGNVHIASTSEGKEMVVDGKSKWEKNDSVEFKVQQPLMTDGSPHLEDTHTDMSLNPAQTLIDHFGQNGSLVESGVAGSGDSFTLIPKENGRMQVAFPVRKSARRVDEKVGSKSFQKKSQNGCADVQLGQVSPSRWKKIKSLKAAVKVGSLKNDQTGLVQTAAEIEVRTFPEDDKDRDQTFADCCTELQPHNSGGDYSAEVQVYNSGGSITFSCGDTESKKILKEARLSARKTLLDAGWRIEFWQRKGRSKEAVYISPDGRRRCWSLTAACRLWRKCQNMSSDNWDGESFEVRLLNTYDLTEGFELLEEHLTRAKRRKLFDTNGKYKNSFDRGHSGNIERIDITPEKGDTMNSRFSTEVLAPNGNNVTLSSEGHPSRIKNIILATEVSDKLSGRATEGAVDGINGSAIKHARKFSISTQEMGLKTSPEEGSEQGSRCKGGLLSSTEEMLVSGKKCKKRKLFMQDGRPSNELKHMKSRTASKKAGSFVEKKGGRSRGGCHMQVLLSLPGKDGDASIVQGAVEASHLRKRTVLSWLIDMGVLAEEERVCYLSRKDGHIMKEGHVAREGVLCKCCMTVFTLSNFEYHAGSKLHRPSANMFLDDGRSLSECQMQAWALQNGSKQLSSSTENREERNDSSDDTCGICGDGGELILCDHCPSTYHADCLGLETIPEGDWFCPSCRCGMCGGSHFNGDGDGLGQKTALLCDQCEREYHISCLEARGMLKMVIHPDKSWFCGDSCEKIFLCLRRLVGIVNHLEKGLSCTLLRCMEEDPGMNIEVVAEHNSKLSVALAVMQECFVPMVDPRTKIDIIAQVLYNRRSKVHRLNYRGFYTMLLERGDEIISVATVRIHGSKVAEMPLIGTRFQYRRQGMCRRLMHALEEMLRSIGVEKLILPAVPELLETWLGAFNFQHMSCSEKRELMELTLMSFPGTTLLRKFLAVQQDQSNERLMEGQLKEHANQLWSFPCDGSVYPVERCLLLETSKDQVQLVEAVQNKKERAVGGSLDEGQSRSIETRSVEKSNTLTGRTDLSGNDDLEQASPGDQVLKVGFLRGKLSETVRGNSASVRDPLETPAVQDFTVSGRYKMKGQNKCRAISERSAPTFGAGSRSHDDDIYRSKVVLTTTRSKRLVKSSRWVADALKELSRDGKNSRLTSFMEDGGLRNSASRDSKTTSGNLCESWCRHNGGSRTSVVTEPKSASRDPTSSNALESQSAACLMENGGSRTTPGSESKATSCDRLGGEVGPRNDEQGDGQPIGNVYIRTRKRMSKQAVLLEESKLLQRMLDFSVESHSSVKHLNSINLDASKYNQDGMAVNLFNSQMTHLNSQQESMQRLADTGLPEAMAGQDECVSGSEEHMVTSEVRESIGGSTCVVTEMRENRNGTREGAEGLWRNTKYYSRRRRKQQRSMATDDLAGLPLSLERSLVPSVGDGKVLSHSGKMFLHEQVVERPKQESLSPDLGVLRDFKPSTSLGSMPQAVKEEKSKMTISICSQSHSLRMVV